VSADDHVGGATPTARFSLCHAGECSSRLNRMKQLIGFCTDGLPRQQEHSVDLGARPPRPGQIVELFTELDKMLDETLGHFDARPWHRDRPQVPRCGRGCASHPHRTICNSGIGVGSAGRTLPSGRRYCGPEGDIACLGETRWWPRSCNPARRTPRKSASRYMRELSPGALLQRQNGNSTIGKSAVGTRLQELYGRRSTSGGYRWLRVL